MTLRNIAHVDPAEFKPYLTRIGPSYERLRNVEGTEDEAANNFRNKSGETDECALVLQDGTLRSGQQPPPTRKNSIPRGSSSLLMEVRVPGPVRRWNPEVSRRATQDLPSLTTIPPVYFDADFRLENPRTFDVVTERSEVVPSRINILVLDEKKVPANPSSPGGAPRKALATNAIL